MQAEKFSRYEIRKELGRGGMATVYLAYDPLFEREVALKILNRELLNNAQVRERFERETKIIARLEHPAIVPVHDVGRDNDQLFYVMRYMTGGSLSDRMSARTLSLAESVHIIQRIASALDYAHARDVIHRDLKPGNILFDDDGNAFISDFGIAKLASSQTKLTSSGIIGTPTYMSPEQAMGENVDARSDIYSLGIILFEMLSGKLPYEATTPLAMVVKHVNEPIPHILDINPNLPTGIELVLEKTLAKNRNLRYARAGDMITDLLDLFPEGITKKLEYTIPITQRGPNGKPVLQKQGTASMSRAWLVGGIILFLAVFALAGWQFFGGSASPTPSPTATTAFSSTSAVLPPPQSTGTETPPPSPSPTLAPTATFTPTVTPQVGIGGADKIAVVANKDVWVMGLDGSNPMQVTNSDQPKFDLQWLPGGKEILYGEGRCIRVANIETGAVSDVTCLQGANFTGFRVSPDGRQAAVTIERRVIIVPFDREALARAKNAFDLQTLPDACLDYSVVSAKFALWSADSKKLALLYQDIRGQRFADIVRVMDVSRCKASKPLILDEFPARRFTLDGYEANPVIPSYEWNGKDLFLFNTFIRNAGYGDLYLYDMNTNDVRQINPVDNTCCYRDARFSPDGKYILFVFQDVRQGAESETQLYYLPIDQFETGTDFKPIRLPPLFFPNVRESNMPALRATQP
jgi:serine/threonine protein kinase